MEWLQELPWQVFWFGWGMVALLAGGSLYAVWWARRNIKAITAQTPVDVSDVAEGYRLAWGRTVGPDLAAPLTGRACAWWKAQVWESVRDRDSTGKYRHVWREIASEESDRPLLFGDGKAVAAIWTSGATAVVPSGWSDWRGQAMPPEERNPDIRTGGTPGQGIRNDVQGTFGPRFRYIEQIIERDTPLFALGKVVRVDAALFAPEDDMATGDQGTASEDPEIDESSVDENPVGDDGWRPEPSRLGTLETPDHVIAEDMARATWAIGAANGQPFLISTEHPDAVSAEQELGAKGGLIMGGIFTFLALVLAWVRLLG